MRALGHHSAPYPHQMQPGECSRLKSFKLEGEAFSDKGTIGLTLEEEVTSAPPQSPTPAARTVSFLMDHQLELSIRALQTARFLDQNLTFWLMQGSIIANSFGHYRLELAIDLTEEEWDQMVHQLAGLGD